MRLCLACACGCAFTLELEPWGRSPEGEFRACPAHGRLTGETGDPARRPLSGTDHEEGGGG
jgi:hypothetical protein